MESARQYTKRELKQEELFNSIMSLKYRIQGIAGIVQNPMDDAPDYVFNEWNENVNDLINTINSLKMDVLDFYKKR